MMLNCPFPAKNCKKEQCLKNCFPCIKPVHEYLVCYLEELLKEKEDGSVK